MDAGENESDCFVSEDVPLVESQELEQSAQLNNSLSSLEIPSDFCSQQIGDAFEELKTVTKKHTNNLQLSDFDSNDQISKSDFLNTTKPYVEHLIDSTHNPDYIEKELENNNFDNTNHAATNSCSEDFIDEQSSVTGDNIPGSVHLRGTNHTVGLSKTLKKPLTRQIKNKSKYLTLERPSGLSGPF